MMPKTVFITGAASGIGQAIAVEFAKEGACVALADIAPSVTDLAAEMGREHSVRAIGYQADVADFQAVQQMTQAILDPVFRNEMF